MLPGGSTATAIPPSRPVRTSGAIRVTAVSMRFVTSPRWTNTADSSRKPGKTGGIIAGMHELGFHGDAELAPGLVDLAVNVRTDPLPDWLAGPIATAVQDLAAYPDPGPARAALAARHRRPADEVLLTA